MTFTLFVENLGNATLENLELIDDVDSIFGSSLANVSIPQVQNFNGAGSLPTINPAWIGDTSQNILSGGVLSEGGSFEVVFTVTLDPDAAGAPVSPGNQAEITGLALNPDGSSTGGPNSSPQLVDDLSDAGTDPGGENGTDNGDGVPDLSLIHI